MCFSLMMNGPGQFNDLDSGLEGRHDLQCKFYRCHKRWIFASCILMPLRKFSEVDFRRSQ